MATTETSQANSEVPPKEVSTRRKWLRRVTIVGSILLGAGLVHFFSARGLNESERRFVGVWTYQDAPGRMVLNYRSDRTMRSSGRPYESVGFVRWHVADDKLMVEYGPRNRLMNVAAQTFGKVGPEVYPVRFLDNGNIEIEETYPDGTTNPMVMIPWTGAFADKIQQVE